MKLKTALQQGLFFSLLLSLLVNNSCGLGQGATDDALKQQRQDYAKLEVRYKKVQGVYRGTMKQASTGENLPATLVIYYTYIDSGPNVDGSRRTPPVLQARFRLDDEANDTDNLVMFGDYAESFPAGLLQLSYYQSNSPPTSPTPTPVGGSSTIGTTTGSASPYIGTLTIRGTVLNGHASDLAVVREDGLWGTFNGDRVDSNPHSADGGLTASDTDRLTKLFRPAEGRYVGTVKQTRTGLEIDLAVSFSANPNYPVVLQGKLSWIGSGNLTVVNLATGPPYNPRTGKISMYQSNQSAGQPLGFSLQGYVKDGIMRVEVRNRDGRMGDFVGHRL